MAMRTSWFGPILGAMQAVQKGFGIRRSAPLASAPASRYGTYGQLQKTTQGLYAEHDQARADRRTRDVATARTRWRRGQASGIQAEQDAANRANQNRYASIITMLRRMGKGEMRRTERRGRREQAMMRQRLVSRGLGNTTVVGPMMRRIQESVDLSRLDIQDRVTGRVAGVMERRTDAGPEMGLLAQLLSRLGPLLQGSSTTRRPQTLAI